MNKGLNAVVAIVTGVIGLAALAVVLGRGSNTVGVLNAAGSSLGNLIKAAVAPASGGM